MRILPPHDGSGRRGGEVRETDAIPHLLNLLDLKNKVVTIDAAGTQKSIAKAIHEQSADYVLTLKRKHPALYDEVSADFLDATDSGNLKLRYKEAPQVAIQEVK